jgi:hypothetical protein
LAVIMPDVMVGLFPLLGMRVARPLFDIVMRDIKGSRHLWMTSVSESVKVEVQVQFC